MQSHGQGSNSFPDGKRDWWRLRPFKGGQRRNVCKKEIEVKALLEKWVGRWNIQLDAKGLEGRQLQEEQRDKQAKQVSLFSGSLRNL
jgi:hypothetical protein